MQLRLSLDPPGHLVVQLVEGAERVSVAVGAAKAGAQSVSRALEAAAAHGYGECFWPGLEGGLYWWMFRRDGDSVEAIAMWSRGGASGWQHVFRATDGWRFLVELWRVELSKLDLPVPR